MIFFWANPSLWLGRALRCNLFVRDLSKRISAAIPFASRQYKASHPFEIFFKSRKSEFASACNTIYKPINYVSTEIKLRLWHRVMTMSAPGVASNDSINREVKTFKQSVFQKSFLGILRARRCKTARSRKKW